MSKRIHKVGIGEHIPYSGRRSGWDMIQDEREERRNDKGFTVVTPARPKVSKPAKRAKPSEKPKPNRWKTKKQCVQMLQGAINGKTTQKRAALREVIEHASDTALNILLSDYLEWVNEKWTDD